MIGRWNLQINFETAVFDDRSGISVAYTDDKPKLKKL